MNYLKKKLFNYNVRVLRTKRLFQRIAERRRVSALFVKLIKLSETRIATYEKLTALLESKIKDLESHLSNYEQVESSDEMWIRSAKIN